MKITPNRTGGLTLQSAYPHTSAAGERADTCALGDGVAQLELEHDELARLRGAVGIGAVEFEDCTTYGLTFELNVGRGADGSPRYVVRVYEGPAPSPEAEEPEPSFHGFPPDELARRRDDFPPVRGSSSTPPPPSFASQYGARIGTPTGLAERIADRAPAPKRSHKAGNGAPKRKRGRPRKRAAEVAQ